MRPSLPRPLLLILLFALLAPVLTARAQEPARSFTVFLSDLSAFLTHPDAALLQSGEMPDEAQIEQMKTDWNSLSFPLPREEEDFPDTKLQTVIRGDSLSYQLRYTSGDLLIRFILPAALPEEDASPIGTLSMDGRVGQIYPGTDGSVLSVYFGGSTTVRVNFYVDSIPDSALDPFVWSNHPGLDSPAKPDQTASEAVDSTADAPSCASVLPLSPLLLLPLPVFLLKRKERP